MSIDLHRTLSRCELSLQLPQSTPCFLERPAWLTEMVQGLEPTGLPLRSLSDSTPGLRLLRVNLQKIDQAIHIDNLAQKLLAIFPGVIEVTEISDNAF